MDRKFVAFYQNMGIKHVTSSVEHLQANGQAEAVNKAIVKELKIRLGEAKGAWVDELLEVLWSYRCTPHDITRETPFNLTYGMDAVLLMEVGEPTVRREQEDMERNEEQLREELDTLQERREVAVGRSKEVDSTKIQYKGVTTTIH